MVGTAAAAAAPKAIPAARAKATPRLVYTLPLSSTRGGGAVGGGGGAAPDELLHFNLLCHIAMLSLCYVVLYTYLLPYL